MSSPLLMDFLYSDHERVAAFLAQIHGAGTITGSEETASKGKTSSKKGGLKLGIIEGDLGSERDWNKEVRLTYDPLWSNSKRLIEHIRTEGVSSLQPIEIAQLRVLSGKLLAYDNASITNILQSSEMDDFIVAGMLNDESSDKRSAKVKLEKKKEATVIRTFLRSLPLGVGFVLVTDTAHFWFSVKREFLSLHELDIPLKFPVHISGDWSVLGVIDALPNDHVEGIQPVIDRAIDGLMPSMVFNMMQLTGAMVGLFGRPMAAFGLSPLIVFREVRT